MCYSPGKQRVIILESTSVLDPGSQVHLPEAEIAKGVVAVLQTGIPARSGEDPNHYVIAPGPTLIDLSTSVFHSVSAVSRG